MESWAYLSAGGKSTGEALMAIEVVVEAVQGLGHARVLLEIVAIVLIEQVAAENTQEK